MANLKITFQIEIDGNKVVEHKLEKIIHKANFELERNFSIEFINKLNTLYTKSDAFQQNWPDLENIKQNQDIKEIPANLREYFISE